MADTDNLEPSANVEDRRGESSLPGGDFTPRWNMPDENVVLKKSLSPPKSQRGAPKNSLGDQAGMNNFADGGQVGTDNNTNDQYDEDDTQTSGGILPTVEDEGTQYDQDQTNNQTQNQPGGGDTSPSTPGAAQSGGTQPSQLMQLVRAVHSYGMHMASQDQSQNQGQNQSQAQSFEEGGAIGDDTSQEQTPQGAIPQGAPQAQPTQDTTQGIPEQGAPQAPQQSGLQKFIQGDKALDPQTMAAIEHAVDPDGSMPGAARKAQAIQYAYQRGMEQTQDPREAMNMALGALQHQRKQFDMWRTAAAVKANQGDMGSSIQAANKAFESPFGHSVHFAPVGNGSGSARSFEDGGSTDDDDENLSIDKPNPQGSGAIPNSQPAPAPGYQQAGPFTDEEQGFNNREQFLDKYGFGTASAKQRLNDARQSFAEKGPDQGPDPTSFFGPQGPIGNAISSGAKGVADWWNGTPPAVTATVTDDQGAPVKTIPLGKDDFTKALTTGTMSFDHFVQQGVPDTLSGGPPQPQTQTQSQTQTQQKGVFDDIKNFDWAGRKAELQQQAHEIFPMASQGGRAAAWVNSNLNAERMQMYRSVLPIQKVQYIQDQQNQRQDKSLNAAQGRIDARDRTAMERKVFGEEAIDNRTRERMLNGLQTLSQKEANSDRGRAIGNILKNASDWDDAVQQLSKAGISLNTSGRAPQIGGQSQRAPSAGGTQSQTGNQTNQSQGGTWLPKFKGGKPVWVNDLTGEERAAGQ